MTAKMQECSDRELKDLLQNGLLNLEVRERIGYKLHLDDQVLAARKEVGRPLYFVIILRDGFLTTVIPFYLVEEPVLCKIEIANIFKVPMSKSFMDMKFVASILNHKDLVDKPALVKLAALLVIEQEEKIRKIVLEIDQSRYDPVVIMVPVQRDSYSFQVTVMMKLPTEGGPLEFVD